MTGRPASTQREGLKAARLLMVLSSILSLPRFRRHPGSHGSAIGVCHGETEATSVLG